MSGGSARPVLVRLYTRLSGDKVRVSAAVGGEAHIASGGRLELELVPADTGAVGGLWHGPAKVLARRTLRGLMPGAREEAVFNRSEAGRSTCIRATFITRDGERCETEVIQDKRRKPPAWFCSDAGVTRSVPAPWTPLKTHKRRDRLAVECWGREYRFSEQGLLEQATATGVPLLAGPVRLVGRADGRPIRWAASPLKLVRAGRDQVVFSRQWREKVLTLDARMEMDFDGMLRVDVLLTPRRPVRIQELALEIPLRSECVKYGFQYGRAPGRRKMLIGPLPPRGFVSGFRPYFWLGDEERGFAWFTETDAEWHIADPEKVLEVSRRGKTTLLRARLISAEVEADPGVWRWVLGTERPRRVERLQYTFGFQATPVKPVEKDVWDYRIVHLSVGHELRLARPALERLAAAGVRTLAIHEHWCDNEAHVLTRHGAALRKIVRDCHARGIQVLLYFGFLLSERAPEWEDFGHECLALPKTGWPIMSNPPQPLQSAWRVCLKSAWQDFLPWGIAEVMDKFDVDGVYLDGTADPMGCRNALHGCGRLKLDGSVGATFGIFAVRSAMRRIYQVVKSRKPDGQVNIHNSGNVVAPTIGWGTSTWDGEQLSGMRKGTPAEQFLPLQVFRTEFMGRQWGVPAELLCYENKPLSFPQTWALALLHDVPVRPILSKKPGNLEFASAIWKVMERFDRKGAEWLPYWRNAEFATVSPSHAAVSLYRHPENGVLAVVSNLGQRAGQVSLALNLRRLEIDDAKIQAADAVTGEAVCLSGGHAAFSLKPVSFKLLWIR